MKVPSTWIAFGLLVPLGGLLRFAPATMSGSELLSSLARVRRRPGAPSQPLGYYEHLAGAAPSGRGSAWDGAPEPALPHAGPHHVDR